MAITKNNGTINAEPISHDFIEVFGARVHNLKNIDIAIPKNKMVVITGISGSGNLRWHLILFMQKGKDVIWKPSAPMPVSSLAIWKGRM